MARPPLAALSDLEVRLETPLSPEEESRAMAAIDDASALVRAEAGQTWLNDLGELTEVPDIAVSITLAVAMRRIQNSDGMISESIGNYRYQLAGGDNVAGVYLTDEERRALRALRTSRVGVITFTSPHYWPPVAGVPTDQGGDPIPW